MIEAVLLEYGLSTIPRASATPSGKLTVYVELAESMVERKKAFVGCGTFLLFSILLCEKPRQEGR